LASGNDASFVERSRFVRHAHYTGMLSRGHRLFLPFGVR
jgi:hypothetical protein